MDGLKYGWVGVLAGLGNNIIDYATSNMLDMTGALINGLFYHILLCNGVLYWIYFQQS